MRRTVGWLAAGLAAFLTALYLTPPYDSPSTLVPWLHWAVYLTPMVMSTGASLLVARATTGVDRRLWAILAVLVGLSLANDASSLWTSLTWGSVPSATSPKLIVVVITATALFAVLTVAVMRVSSASLATRMRIVADLFIIAVVGGVLAHVWFVTPVLRSVGPSELGLQLAVTLRVVFGLLIMVGTGLLALELAVSDWRPWERATLAGVSFYGLGLALWPVYFVAEYMASNSMMLVSDVLWMSGHYLVFSGAVLRMTPMDRPQELRGLPPVSSQGRWMPLVFHGLALVALAALGWTAFLAGDSSEALIAMGAATIVALLLVVRDFWIAYESGQLQQLVGVDQKTGVHTESAFIQQLESLVEVSVRKGSPFSLLLIDVDDLGVVNSLAGRDAGHELLLECARIIVQNVPAEGYVARIDGDAFGVTLPGVEQAEAMMRAEHIRAQIELSTWGTVSSGVATFPHDSIDADVLMTTLKDATDFAGRHGGNRVVSARRAQLQLTRDGTGGGPDSKVSTLRLLAASVDARHVGTRNHSAAVADLAVALAQELGLAAERVDALRLAAGVHDVGMIGVSAHLDCDEHLPSADLAPEVKAHAELGEQIAVAAGLGVAATWIRSHHERWDGEGYPDGLRGPEIPLESRILAVCDVFVGLTHSHGDRSAISARAALREIDLNLGTAFDPEVAEAFLHLAEERFVLAEGAAGAV